MRVLAIIVPMLLLLDSAVFAASPEGDAQKALTAPAGRVAFGMAVDDNVDVYSVEPDGSGLLRLTDGPGFEACPDWMHDGSTIAYCADTDGAFEIWTMGADGTRKRQVTSLGGSALFPDLSPDGSLIAFELSVDEGPPQVFVSSLDGTNPIALTSEGSNSAATWSPDGTRIAFISERAGAPQVWVMAADGSDQRPLTSDGLVHGAPEWSPDGTRIAYDTISDEVPQVWVMAADGADPIQLTDDASGNGGPAWSPDGSRIAFMSWRLEPRAVFTMAADGSDQVPLAPGAGPQFVPAWQPLVASGGSATTSTGEDGSLAPVPPELLGSYIGEGAYTLAFTIMSRDDRRCERWLARPGDCYAVHDIGTSPAQAVEYGHVGMDGGQIVFRAFDDPIEECRGMAARFTWTLADELLTLHSIGPECHGASTMRLRRVADG